MQATFGQLAGQFATGSHFSPQDASTVPLPQVQLQSSSMPAHPAGQQLSPVMQAVWGASSTQRAVQLAAEPSSLRRMQPLGGQLVGQVPGGSQVSPGSTLSLPQAAPVGASTPVAVSAPASLARAIAMPIRVSFSCAVSSAHPGCAQQVHTRRSAASTTWSQR